MKEAQITSAASVDQNAMQPKDMSHFANQARCSLFSATKPQPPPPLSLSLSLFPPTRKKNHNRK